MDLQRFGQRISSLERSLRRCLQGVDRAGIAERVLATMSDEDLCLLARVQRGTISCEALTDRDCAALQAFIDAVQKECQGLGFSSWEALERWTRPVNLAKPPIKRARQGR